MTGEVWCFPLRGHHVSCLSSWNSSARLTGAQRSSTRECGKVDKVTLIQIKFNLINIQPNMLTKMLIINAIRDNTAISKTFLACTL